MVYNRLKKISISVFLFILTMPSLALGAAGGSSLFDISEPNSDTPPLMASDIENFVETLQNIVFGAAGGIAVAMIIWGAIILTTAGGNEERVAKGKKILTYAIGGIILIVASYSLTIILVKLLGGDVK